MIENQIVRQLHGIAEKLTADTDLQKDLMQEMFVHLVRIQTTEAGQSLTWYLKSCELHARNHPKLNGSVDSLKRDGALSDQIPHVDSATDVPPTRSIEIQGELITNETANRILPQLSDRQQQVLFLLMKGCGVREAARELGVTHPAVIKHRKKIARVARELLHSSEHLAVVVHNSTKSTAHIN